MLHPFILNRHLKVEKVYLYSYFSKALASYAQALLTAHTKNLIFNDTASSDNSKE